MEERELRERLEQSMLRLDQIEQQWLKMEQEIEVKRGELVCELKAVDRKMEEVLTLRQTLKILIVSIIPVTIVMLGVFWLVVVEPWADRIEHAAGIIIQWHNDHREEK